MHIIHWLSNISEPLWPISCVLSDFQNKSRYCWGRQLCICPTGLQTTRLWISGTLRACLRDQMALPATHRNYSECRMSFSTHHHPLFILGSKHFTDLFLYRSGLFWGHPEGQWAVGLGICPFRWVSSVLSSPHITLMSHPFFWWTELVLHKMIAMVE